MEIKLHSLISIRYSSPLAHLPKCSPQEKNTTHQPFYNFLNFKSYLLYSTSSCLLSLTPTSSSPDLQRNRPNKILRPSQITQSTLHQLPLRNLKEAHLITPPHRRNISTNIIRLRPNMIAPGLRIPHRSSRTGVSAQELVDTCVETGVVDVQLVLAFGVSGAET